MLDDGGGIRHPPDPEYWMAYLAATIAHALAAAPGDTKRMLRGSLSKFMGSGCCSVRLAEDIRKTTKGAK